MKEKNRGKDVGLWLRLVGFALLPLSVQVFQPVIGSQLSLLIPLPLAYGMARRGYLEGTAATGFVALLTFLFLGVGYGMSFLCLILPMTFGIGWVVRSRVPLYRTVLLATGLVVGSMVIGTVSYGLITGTGPAGLYQEMVNESTQVLETITSSRDLTPDEQLQFQWAMETTLRILVGFTLSLVMLLVTFYALVIRQWLVSENFLDNEGLAPLSQWALPFWFVGIFVVLASAWLLSKGVVRDAALNCLFPLGTLYGIQGIVIIGHLFTRWKLPPFFRIMILFFGILSFRQIAMILVALMGLFDTWIDFRRRWPLEMTPAP